VWHFTNGCVRQEFCWYTAYISGSDSCFSTKTRRSEDATDVSPPTFCTDKQ
jgi:hypothetical protein